MQLGLIHPLHCQLEDRPPISCSPPFLEEQWMTPLLLLPPFVNYILIFARYQKVEFVLHVLILHAKQYEVAKLQPLRRLQKFQLSFIKRHCFVDRNLLF